MSRTFPARLEQRTVRVAACRLLAVFLWCALGHVLIALAGGVEGAAPRCDPLIRTAAELNQTLGQVLSLAFPGRMPLWELPRPHAFGASGPSAYHLLNPKSIKGGRNWFQLRDAEASGKAYLLPVDVFWEDSVWVAARALQAHRRLGQDDLMLQVSKHTFLRAEIRFDGSPVGLCVKRAMNAGEVITRTLLGPPPLVERGQIVRLIYQSPGLLVSARAEALESGAWGETIRVRPLDARKACQGVVKSAYEVEVMIP